MHIFTTSDGDVRPLAHVLLTHRKSYQIHSQPTCAPQAKGGKGTLRPARKVALGRSARGCAWNALARAISARLLSWSGSELCHFLGDDSGSGVVDSVYRSATYMLLRRAVRKAYDGLRTVEQESRPGPHEVKLLRCTVSKERTCACTYTAARRAEAALTLRFSRWMISTTIPADRSGAREGPSGKPAGRVDEKTAAQTSTKMKSWAA